MPETSTARAAAIIRTIPDQPDAIDPGYIRFPNHLAERLWLFGDGPSLMVYMALLKHARNNTVCWPSQAKLQQMTGLSPRSIARGRHNLEKMGLLQTDWWRRRNRYHLIPMLTPKKQG